MDRTGSDGPGSLGRTGVAERAEPGPSAAILPPAGSSVMIPERSRWTIGMGAQQDAVKDGRYRGPPVSGSRALSTGSSVGESTPPSGRRGSREGASPRARA